MQSLFVFRLRVHIQSQTVMDAWNGAQIYNNWIVLRIKTLIYHVMLYREFV